MTETLNYDLADPEAEGIAEAEELALEVADRLGEEEAEQPKDNIDSLWLNTQEVLARSQGIINEGDKVE